ncbi:hypothetical protein BH09MYX1_BH09MYX1_28620 [soil metagenome]
MWRSVFLSVLALGIVSCGSDPTSVFGPDGGDAAIDVAANFTLRVEPPDGKATGTIGLAPPTLSFKAVKTESGADVDVTDQVTWSIADPTFASINAKGVVTFVGRGGESAVTAILGSVKGSAKATLVLSGDLYLSGTDAKTKQAFEGATLDATASPVLEYPESGTVLPANLPPIEFQWSQTDGVAFRAHLTGKYLDMWIYTTAVDWTPDKDVWSVVRSSTTDQPDAGTSWTVESLSATKVKRASTARTFNTAIDSIDDSAIYVWQSSTGSFRVIDVGAGKEFALPNDSPQLAPNQPCSGCHRISRDGKRFAFTYGDFNFGSLTFDANAKTYKQKITPSPSFRATYAAFDPMEAARVPAMLVTVPDAVPQNTAGTVRLELRDPETNAVIPSNLAAALAQLDATTPGRATSMPDWSPDGSFIVFAAYSSDKNYVRLLGDDIVNASIVEMPVSFSGGTYTFGAPKVLVAASTAADGDTGSNFFLPTVSPDGTAVAYSRSNGWWSIKTQQSLLNLSGQISVVRRSDNQAFVLANGSPGVGVSNTWPQWAPTVGARYSWLAYGSERPYGHELTLANKSCGALVQGQQSCKQLWVMAVDTAKLKSGIVDPSFAPFWIPGQSVHAQYVSPQWTKAVVSPPN